MRSYYSTVIDAPLDTVWQTARDFNRLATWYSAAVSHSRIEENKPDDQISAVGNFTMGDGEFRERLIGLDDARHRVTYTFEGPPPSPATDYLAALQVTSITDGDRAFIEWWTDFECEAAEREHWTSFFATEVFAPALESLSTHIIG